MTEARNIRSTADWITPDWPAPPIVRACSTTRSGGISAPPYAAFNLAEHVGDSAARVAQNRAALIQALDLPAEPVWLKQVHGATVLDATQAASYPEADAAYADRAGVVCTVLTADCLPLLLCDSDGSRVAAVHAGWRGLAAGVIEATLNKLGPPSKLLAWLGPAIGPHAFEVGDEVREIFITRDAAAQHAFRPSPAGRWLADLYTLARQRLRGAGVSGIYGGDYCTCSEHEKFYSYRREAVTGRMATLIWIDETSDQ